jgi:hypothetical protein
MFNALSWSQQAELHHGIHHAWERSSLPDQQVGRDNQRRPTGCATWQRLARSMRRE